MSACPSRHLSNKNKNLKYLYHNSYHEIEILGDANPRDSSCVVERPTQDPLRPSVGSGRWKSSTRRVPPIWVPFPYQCFDVVASRTPARKRQELRSCSVVLLRRGVGTENT